MNSFDFGFGFFAYLIDWFGLSHEQASGGAANTTTVSPIGG